MEKEKYLKQLKLAKSLEDVCETIKKIFWDSKEYMYIPAIIDEGSFALDKGEDFYLKLILKHQAIEISKTWMKKNMWMGIEEPYDIRTNKHQVDLSAYIHNVITFRKYKSRNLYQLNPLIVPSEVEEYEYNNAIYVNAYYNDEYSTLKGMPVIKEGKYAKLEILKDVLKNYINDKESITYPKYELVAEFEYRSHNSMLENIKTGKYKTKDGYFDINLDNSIMHMLGSIKIPYLDILKNKKSSRNIRVLNFDNGEEREHNPNNYDGDIEEGFICFKIQVIDILRDYYFFYDLHIFDKENVENSYLIDVLSDKVVFWEGEYNKLPNFIKDKIDIYNFVPDSIDNLISKAMFAMQLEVDWNWNEKLFPDYKLANFIRENIFERAIDLGITFISPQNPEDMKNFILNIEKLLDIKLERFNIKAKDVSLLIKIRDSEEINEDVKNLQLLYQKYCYAIYMELKNEN